MSVSALYRLCAIQIGTTVIGQIVDQELTDDISELLAPDSIAGYNRAAGVDLEDQRITVTTTAVKTALATVPLAGLDLAAGAAVLFFAGYTQGGGIAAAGCVTFTAAKGLAVVRSISAGGGLATCTIEIVPVSPNGTTAPIIKATGVALPTCVTEEMYVAGGATGIQEFAIDTGIEVETRRGDADTYHTFCAVGPAQPRVTFGELTMGDVGAVTDRGTLTLQDATKGGGRGSAPITFTFNQSMANARRIGPANEYALTPTYDGTNAPIVITGIT